MVCSWVRVGKGARDPQSHRRSWKGIHARDHGPCAPSECVRVRCPVSDVTRLEVDSQRSIFVVTKPLAHRPSAPGRPRPCSGRPLHSRHRLPGRAAWPGGAGVAGRCLGGPWTPLRGRGVGGASEGWWRVRGGKGRQGNRNTHINTHNQALDPSLFATLTDMDAPGGDRGATGGAGRASWLRGRRRCRCRRRRMGRVAQVGADGGQGAHGVESAQGREHGAAGEELRGWERGVVG